MMMISLLVERCSSSWLAVASLTQTLAGCEFRSKQATHDHVVGHSRVDDEAASVPCCHLESCQSEKDTSAVGVPC
jgi:hypothetical protein